MAQDVTNYSAILKEYYNPDRVAKMILSSSPFLAMVPKKRIFGSSWPLPVIYAGTSGRSANFTTALANKGQTSSTRFQITTNEDYALASISRKLLLASESDLGAFLPAAQTNIDAAFTQLRRSLAICAFRDGSGARGQVSSYTPGPPDEITLTSVADAVNFQVSDVIVFRATKSGGAVSSTATITAINRSTGVLTIAGTAPAANDYIFCEGDADSVLSGLEGWLPSTTPTSTSFFGVDRTVDTDMLGGVRYNGTGLMRFEALINGQSQIGAIGDGRPSHAFLNPEDFRQLILELESQARRYRDADVSVPVRKGTNAAVGFTGVIVQGDAGEFQVFSDRFCPAGVCYVLQLEDWKMCHMGPELVDIVGRDSDKGMLTETTTDGYEIRITSYPQLACAAPGHSGVIYNFGA